MQSLEQKQILNFDLKNVNSEIQHGNFVVT